MSPSTNNIAFTSAINPSGSSPILTRQQMWNGLLIKIKSAETFVPQAIESTKVVNERLDDDGNAVTAREVIFKEGSRKVSEVVTAFEQVRVEFQQTDGSRVSNVISEGAEGELYMTYIFEWRHPGASKEELKAFYEREQRGSKGAVESTIIAMRKLAQDGKI